MIVEELVTVLGLEINPIGLEEFRRNIVATTSKIAGLIGVTLGAAAAINSLLTETGRAAADSRFAEQIDVGFEALQRLDFAAGQAGVSTGQLKGILVGLRNAAQGAFTGQNQGAAESFALLGIAVEDANGQLKTADNLLLEVANRIKNTQNRPLDLQIAQRLGITPESLLLFELGADGIRQLGDEAARAGLILSGEAAEGAIEFDQQLDKLSRTLNVLLVESGRPFIAWLTESAEAFAKFVASDVAKDMATTIGNIAGAIGKISLGSIELVGKLSDALAELGLPKTAQGLLTVGSAVLRFFGPVGLVIAGFAAAAEDLNQFLEGNENTVTGTINSGFPIRTPEQQASRGVFAKFMENMFDTLTRAGDFLPGSGAFAPPSLRAFGTPGSNALTPEIRVDAEIHIHGNADVEEVGRELNITFADLFREAWEKTVSDFKN